MLTLLKGLISPENINKFILSLFAYNHQTVVIVKQYSNSNCYTILKETCCRVQYRQTDLSGLIFFLTIKQVAGAGFGGPLWGKENITHRKQTEKQKLKMATIAPKQVPVIYLGKISLESEYQLSSPSNDLDTDKSFRSSFCYQEGSGNIFKYSVMLG